MTRATAEDLIYDYIETSYGEFERVIPPAEWLTVDIVKLIELLDAELQRRYDEEQAIRKECYESFQTDLFNLDDEQDYSESDPW